MPPAETPLPDQSERGGRDRGGDRRGNERRRLERRTPLPMWRRPWAFAAYGALVGVVVVGWMMSGAARSNDDPPIEERRTANPAPKEAPVVEPAAPEAAFGAAGFERLALQGPRALGRRVRAVLYCEPPTSFQVRDGVSPEAAVAALTTEGRVHAAECKWGGAEDTRREDFVMLVPPDLAEQFASAPVVTDQFQRRRRVDAVVEWLGRSEALSLRSAGVFRGIAR